MDIDGRESRQGEDGGGAGGLGEEGAGAKENQEIDDGVAGRELRLRVKIIVSIDCCSKCLAR